MNVRDVLRELKIPFFEHGQSSLVSSGWIGTECPRCGKGTGKPGLGIHVRTMRTSCWKCGTAGFAASLAAISGASYWAIKALLGDLAPERAEAPPKGKLEIPAGVGPLLPAHRKYLAGRGFDPDEVTARWGVQGIGATGDKLAWRLYIPVHDPHGTVVSWTTRAIGNVPHGLRYRGTSASQSSVPRSDILYGEQHARHAVVCVEGPTDCWWGGPGFVATAGVGFSKAQILRLSAYPIRAICFDRERRAQQRARELAQALAVYPGETTIIQTSGPDPATSPASERDEIRNLFLE